MVQSNPLLGIGFGHFQQFGEGTSAHNIVLHHLAEQVFILGVPLIMIFFSSLVINVFENNPFGRVSLIALNGVVAISIMNTVLAGDKLVQQTGYKQLFTLYH